MQVLAVIAQIEDGIADELPRAVVSGLPATADLDDGVGQARRIAQAAPVRRAADGINRIVLEQEKLVANHAGPALATRRS